VQPLELVEMTPEQVDTNKRKRFIRRCYKKSPLWAVELAKTVYPNYNASMLENDLRIKYRRKKKHEKFKRLPEDFRSCQIKKYIGMMESSEVESKEYHRACIMISRLTEAHNKRKDIYLTICIGREKVRYGFHWSSSEKFIKAVADLASECTSFEDFENRKDSLIRSMSSSGR
jgi:hypothetical protein